MSLRKVCTHGVVRLMSRSTKELESLIDGAFRRICWV